MDNPEKVATLGTQNEEKKNTTHYELDTTICKQAQITSIIYEPSCKQLEGKLNQTSLYAKIRT
jgi:hypothetical protein